MLQRTLIAILTAAIAWAGGCASHDGAPQETKNHVVTEGFATDSLATRPTIRIATFNIANLGPTKMSKPAIRKALAEIIRDYDIVAVQEVSDKTGQAPLKLLEEVNSDGSRYTMTLSPRTGRQADDKNFQEAYAFYYNLATIERMGQPKLYDDSAEDLFQREPFAARFKATRGTFNFVIISIHTMPDRAVEEIAALHRVNLWVKQQWPGEGDIITLGDFNAGCDYATPAELDVLELRGPGYTWIVTDGADTNVSTTRTCAYDRIVITKSMQGDYADRWGVDDRFTDKAISDHFPVWAQFYAKP